MSSAVPPRPLLVGIDESGRSDEALRAALDLAGRSGAELYAVHALDPRFDGFGRPEAMVESAARRETVAEQTVRVREHLLERVREIAADGRWKGADLRDRVRVLPGPAPKVLLDAAREHDAGTIFLGPHQHRGFLDFGSAARAVLAKTTGSVWMQPSRHRPIARVLVPVDLSPDSLGALATACELAKHWNARVTALHCFVTPEIGYAPSTHYPMPGPTYVLDDVRAGARREFEEAMARFDWRGADHEERFVEGRPAQTALELADEHDLITLGSHGRTGLSSALLGNVAYTILKASTKPVLAIRHPDRRFLL